MGTMQFRDYVFKHNPAHIQIREMPALTEDFCPGRGLLVQNLGRGARVVTCSGSFLGATAEEAFWQAEALRLAAHKERTGLLCLPGQGPFYAHMRELVIEACGEGWILPYTVVFVEQVAL